MTRSNLARYQGQPGKLQRPTNAVRRTPGSIVEQEGTAIINGQRVPIQLTIVNESQPTQEPRRPASTYVTQRSQGNPSQLPSMRLPGLLQAMLALITVTMFLVGASMFSIALTSYSNGIDRIDEKRSFMRVYE